MKILLRKAALLFAACLILPGPGAPAQSQSEPPQAAVRLNVIVLDGKNHAVADLRQEDFRVFENDAPQPVTFFSKEDVRVSYGLLVDSSGSLRSQFQSLLDAGKTIVNANQPGDETFLVRFISSDKISLVQELTPNKALLIDWLRQFQLDRGQTAVIDALFVSAEYLKKSAPRPDITRRRALVIITDGEDRASSTRKGELLKLLREEQIQVFSVGLIKNLDSEGGLLRKSPREQAVKLLEDLAKETGGVAFLVRSASDLIAAANELPRLLRTQYVVGYNPVGPVKKGSSRNIRVRLVDAPGRDKLKVIARPAHTSAQSAPNARQP
jgi:Ca-activated chloride channel family protein